MTTPHQGAPDGAVTVGGGAFSYGQLVNERNHKAAFEIEPPSTLAEALDTLPHVLNMLPNDAMKPWQKFFNMTDQQRADGSVLQQFLDSLEDSPLTKVVTDVKDTIDGLIRGIVGWTETGYTPAQLEQAARDLLVTITDMRAIITALLSANGFAGVAVVYDFTGRADSSSLGAEWDQGYFSGSGSGYWGVKDGRARWVGEASERWCSARYFTETKSDYQKIGAAFASKPSRDLFGGHRSVNRIMGRVSNDRNSFVAVDLEATSVTLGCQVSGSWTTWATKSWSLADPWEFKPGAAYWLECGTTGGARIFRVWENNKVLITFTESGATSGLGAGFRSVGVGVKAFDDTHLPGQVASVAFFDNQPNQKMGSGWRISRTNPAQHDQQTGENNFPASYFDTIDYATDDLVYDVTNNKITVAATGWYHISVVQHGNQSIVGGGAAAPALIVNGAVVQVGPVSRQSGTNTGFGGSFVQYLNAGDNVKPGYWSSWNPVDQLVAEASGTKTYWSGVYLGVSKKLPEEA